MLFKRFYFSRIAIEKCGKSFKSTQILPINRVNYQLTDGRASSGEQWLNTMWCTCTEGLELGHFHATNSLKLLTNDKVRS